MLECPCVKAERGICSQGARCRHFSNIGSCGNCSIKGVKTVKERLIDVINHLRTCRDCAKTDVLRCPVGRELWRKARLPEERTSAPTVTHD